MKSNKDEILRLYFDEKLKQVEIAKRLCISENAVSKTLKKDKRFTKEKNIRKQTNKKKHNKKIQNIVEAKRKVIKQKNNVDDLVLKAMHEQASLELSGPKKSISNRAFRDWNSSIYLYNDRREKYLLKNGINVGFDVPRKINWKI